MGEPAGIGGEISLMAWLARTESSPPFLLIDDPHRLRSLAERLNLAVPVQEIQSVGEAVPVFHRALPVLRLDLPRPVEPGHPHRDNVAAVQASIARAVDLARSGETGAVVTNPIHKKVMQDGGFAFPGHTEFLASLAGEPSLREVMMLACTGLRVVPVSIHVSLAEAVRGLTRGDIVEVGRVTAAALQRDFGIASPRLAVAGLNPHAGEGGAMGREDLEIVGPAVEDLRRAGIDAVGPLPADTMFHARARQGYDAALCMYHDQALIPIKTVDFDHGVNITLGLPFVRTSPDHGTAFELAGTGTASPESLMAAMVMAGEIAANRAKTS
ncbi:4-hydroxythreonine-4-phosphate dehydrogenase PdxA [Paramagnetospirillum kuznetsovii]|nr:4-hydroxythreonine-4-phosphate dehydrogenase PdxA [Paramagnetospirillum kuznetsovii]